MRALIRIVVARWIMPDARYAAIIEHLDAIGRAEHTRGKVL